MTNDLKRSWFTPQKFSLFLAGAIVLLFSDVIFGGRIFIFRDFGFFGYPLAHYYRECFWRGELPLWNPLNNLGLPFLAQWNTIVLYPPSLFYLLLPLEWGLPVFCLAHLFLAGLGMYFLAQTWTENGAAACVAGAAYAFNGLMLNSLMWPNIIAAFGWMPWVVLWAERAWRQGGRTILVAALLGSLQMLTGAVEVILFTWCIVTVLGIVEVAQGRIPVSKLAGRFLVVVGVISAISAMQLLPFFDLLQHSHRDPNFASNKWPLPPWGLANFVVPLFRLGAVQGGTYMQPEQQWTSYYYAGVGVLVIGIGALFVVRDRRLWTAWLLILGGLALAGGEPILGWMRRICPLLGFIQFPAKYVAFSTFLLPLAAAFGISRLMQSSESPCKDCWRALWGVALVCTIIIGFIVWCSYRFPYRDEVWTTTLKSGTTRLLWLALFLGGMGVTALGRNAMAKSAGALSLVLITTLDLVTQAPTLQPTVGSQVYKMKIPCLEQMQPRPVLGGSRALPTVAATKSNRLLSKAEDSYLCSRMLLSLDCNLLDGIPNVDGFFPLYLKHERDISYNLCPQSTTVQGQLADFLAVSQVSHPEKLFEWQARPSALPIITGGQRPVFLDETNVLQAVLATNFEPAKVVYLPMQLKELITAGPSEVKISDEKFQAERISCVVKADAPAMLVVSQSYHHLWRAYVDGRAVQLWRANHAFQALEVPAGEHRVEIRYEDTFFKAGSIVTGLAVMGCVLGWIRALRKKRTAVEFEAQKV